MKIKIVSDDEIIINTQGIRCIEKIDGKSYNVNRGEFTIRISYRQESITKHYTSRESRDAMYNKLKTVMDELYGEVN